MLNKKTPGPMKFMAFIILILGMFYENNYFIIAVFLLKVHLNDGMTLLGILKMVDEKI